MSTFLVLSMTVLSFVTVTVWISSFDGKGFVVTFGRSMGSPCCIMGAVIMNMISSTSMTSTRGMMLISERTPFDCLGAFIG